MTITAEQAAKLLEGTTPGPWVMETVRTSCGTCHRIGPFPRPAYASKPEGWACVYDDYPPGVGSPDLLANSHLIAAAPDLATALIASEAARKLAEERLAKAVERLNDHALFLEQSHDARMVSIGCDPAKYASGLSMMAQMVRAILKEIDNG